MSVEEGLRSEDVELVKKARGVARGTVTNFINRLPRLLIKNTAGNLQCEKIIKTEVFALSGKLDKSHDTFQELHERYSQFRDRGQTSTLEEELQKADDDYGQEVVEKYYSAIADIENYKKEIIVLEKEETEVDLKNLLDVDKLVASEIVSSTDPEMNQSAQSAKESLKVSYDNFVKNKAERRKAMKDRGDWDEDIGKVCDYIAEGKEVRKLISQLDVVIASLSSSTMVEEKVQAVGLDHSASTATARTGSSPSIVKLQKMSCPQFSGLARDFAQFKREFNSVVVVQGRSSVDIGYNLLNAIPAKHQHLINNIDLPNHQEMMKALTDKFGCTRLVIDDVVSQMEKMKVVSTDKGFIEFVEKLEKIDRDLEALNVTEEIANSTVIGKLEARLPTNISIDWSKVVAEKELDKKTSKDVYKQFLAFLKKSKARIEYLTADSRQSSGSTVRSVTQVNFVTGVTLVGNTPFSPKGPPAGDKKNSARNWKPCLACNVDGATDLTAIQHPMEPCAVWDSMSLKDREKKVKCIKHPFNSDHTTQNCTVSGRRCKYCSQDSHHFLLCPKKPVRSKTHVARVSTNSAVTVQPMLPVMVQAQYVNGENSSKIGTLMDLCSTDDYVTHRYAELHHLPGEDVDLVVEGMGRQETFYHTKIYQVPIVDLNKVRSVIPCYGMEEISSVTPPPEAASYGRLCAKFGIHPHQVKRPQTIDLLLSMRQNHLHPTSVSTVEGVTLYRGRFGMVLGGSDPDLVFTPYSMSCPTSVHLVHHTSLTTVHHANTMRAMMKEAEYTTAARTDREFLDYFKEEAIGVECVPKCGGCKCGKCPTGAKQMSIKDEEEYEKFQSLMHLDSVGTEDDPGPYWVSSLPWNIDKDTLVDNKAAVLGVMNSTRRKLDRDPTWKEIYETQLGDLIKKGFAREVMDEEIVNWKSRGGKVYYISHQVALNPASKSTPVRVVFNSSQVYRGFSLNSSWDLGPDVLNNLHGVLLRFRKDYCGGQGDIKKMYYMVRIKMDEQMMQLFVWQFTGEERLRTFCMTRLVMGNKPSGSLSQVALRQTSELNDNAEKYPVAHEAITEDSYVDNIFRTAPDIATLRADIAEIELVSAMGGFFYKEWMLSGHDQPEQLIGVQLPNAIGANEEKALGMYWNVFEDYLYVKCDLVKPSKKPKKNEIIVSVSAAGLLEIKPHLSLRICLSLHAKAYDPLGMVLPTRMFGSLLFRSTLQDLKKIRQGKIPWDEPIDDNLDSAVKKNWLDYFEMLLQLETVTFTRCVKPAGADPDINPDLATFCDGNPDAFGVVAFAIFTLKGGGRSSCLIMSKARLGPLTSKGETVRNELGGATLASRIKLWIIQESGLTFQTHYHFLDSMIVLAMMKKKSYGFNTYAGLRVGEIQQKTNLVDWKHIPGVENIADVLTRGATPDKLGPGQPWQLGPPWLSLPLDQWPVTVQDGRESDLEEEIAKFYHKKSQSNVSKLVQTFASGVKTDKLHLVTAMGSDELDGLICRCGSLDKLIRCVAYVLRWAGRAHRKLPPDTIEISSSEYDDAYHYLIYWEQRSRLVMKSVLRLVPQVIMIKLNNYDISIPLTILAGRVRNFPVGFSEKRNIPILPYGVLAKLVVLHYHDKHHREADTIVTLVRNEVWPVKARKIASSIDSRCRICLEKRKRFAKQEMGVLPDFRSDMLPCFAVTCMDIFGPYEIRDDCVKKGPRIYKKVYGVIYTCASTRAVHLDVAVDYSTEAVLHTLRRLMAVRGDVRLMISDPGSQLVGASNELAKWRKGWDHAQLVRFGASKAMEWKFIMANSQHQNGASEVLIKLVKGVKKSLMHSMGNTRLSLNEMNTLMLEISNLVNERPIGIQPNQNSESDYLSPNSLLLGRSSPRISAGPFQADHVFTDDPKAARTRFLLVQAITEQFWKVWLKIYFPTLLVRQKWHFVKRNLMVGDICLLKDSNVFRSEWRLCEVSNVSPDGQGLVRNVQIRVKAGQGGSRKYVPTSPIYLNRHVSNLLVLVPADERHELGELHHGPQQGGDLQGDELGELHQGPQQGGDLHGDVLGELHHGPQPSEGLQLQEGVDQHDAKDSSKGGDVKSVVGN